MSLLALATGCRTTAPPVTALDQLVSPTVANLEHEVLPSHDRNWQPDLALMPSHFEPCGLNQIYSLRYGTVPIVHKTGGLADTVTNASPESIASGEATGFCFQQANADALWGEIRRALQLYRDRQDLWRTLAINGMGKDFSWRASARRYEQLYREALDDRLPA